MSDLANMPDGLTIKNNTEHTILQQKAIDESLNKFAVIGTKLLSKNSGLYDQLKQLAESQEILRKKFLDEQMQKHLDAETLKQKGVSDKDILSYLNSRQEIYGKDTNQMFESVKQLQAELADMVEKEENISADERTLLRKQLLSMEKSYTLEEEMARRNSKVFSSIETSVAGTFKKALEDGKENRKDLIGSLGTAILGPMRILADPIAEIATGKTTKELSKSIFEDFSNKKEQRAEARKQAQETKITALLENKSNFVPIEPPPVQQAVLDKEPLLLNSPNEFSKDTEQLDPLLEKVNPTANTLLKDGGVIGASAVFIAKEIKGLSEDISDIEIESTEKGGLLNAIKGLVPTIASTAGIAAVAAAPLAMATAGTALQSRDTEDSKKFFEKGETARGIETFLLGDRERLTEENSNAELARTTGKAALLAGGGAGLVALGTGGITAGLTAGAGASAAGAGMLGTGLAAAGATASAILPPVLIAGAVTAAGTMVAKGVQEAYELGWDKNQATIQKELYETIMSSDSSSWNKIKAKVSSGWQSFTGTIAGGVRGATEEIQGSTAVAFQQGLDNLAKQAEQGNTESARLLETIKSEQFKKMSEAEKETLLKSEGLFDNWQQFQKDTSLSVGEKLTTGVYSIADFFTNAAGTLADGFKGEKGAKIDHKALKSFDTLTKPQLDSLKETESYKTAIANGSNKLEALQSAYLDKTHKENEALGIQKADGTAVGFTDYLGTYFNKHLDDEAYKQSRDYSQRKAILMTQGLSSQEAEQQALEEYNTAYQTMLEYRLKQTDDYNENFKKALKEGKSLEQAEKESLALAKANRHNVATVGELVKDKLGTVVHTMKDFAGGVWNSVSGAYTKTKSFITGDTVITPDASIDDGIVTKDGKIIQLSPDDNVYATKNEPRVVGDRDAQRSLPLEKIATPPMTDERIVAAIELLTEVIKKKQLAVTPIIQEHTLQNFDQLRQP